MSVFKVTGLVAATFTPFDGNGDVVLSKVEEHCQHLADLGVKHAFVNGSTGESVSLTLGDRKALASEWVKVNKGRLETVIVHVGCANLRDTVTLASHAEEIGADAISAMPPLFFRPPNVDVLVEYMRKVGEAAPKLPLYYYHIPVVTFVDLNMAEFLCKARDKVPTLRGIKFSSQDLVLASDCIRTKDARGEPYNILYGWDQQLLSALVLGVDGAVGSTYSFLPGVYQRMIEALERGDMETAKKEQYRSQDVCNLLPKYASKGRHTLAVLKAMAALAGLKMGPSRLPVSPLDPDEVEACRKDLEDIGFFEWYRK